MTHGPSLTLTGKGWQFIKKTIKKIIQKTGYDVVFHRVASSNKNTKQVAFIHIPKCGGVSIDTALRAQLAQIGERKIKRKPLIASSLLSFEKEIVRSQIAISNIAPSGFSIYTK